jgi:hypothetical protein
VGGAQRRPSNPQAGDRGCRFPVIPESALVEM